MIPLWVATSWGLTSGTTRGTSGSILQALELSTTTAPARAASGLYSREIAAGVLESTMSTPSKAPALSGSIGYVLPANSTDLPALRGEARNLIEPTGKFRSSKRRVITLPTAPLAPTTATLFTAISLGLTDTTGGQPR